MEEKKRNHPVMVQCTGEDIMATIAVLLELSDAICKADAKTLEDAKACCTAMLEATKEFSFDAVLAAMMAGAAAMLVATPKAPITDMMPDPGGPANYGGPVN